MKVFKGLIFAVLVSMVFVGCGSPKKVEKSSGGGAQVETTDKAESTEARVIKVSTKFVDDEQTAKSLKSAVERINERSNGSLELQLFTNATLPVGKDGMEQVENGSDWILVDGVNFLGDYVPDYNAVTGPMLYQSFEEYFAMTKTPLVEKLNQDAEEKGIKVLSLDWVFGFRNMMTKTPILNPDDMKGLNIRVPTSQLYTFTIEAMGGNPVAMPYPDTYAAIQQGVIDGVEGSIMTYFGTKQYENVKEYSITKHLLGVSSVTVSTQCWNSLTDEQRTIIQEEIDSGAAENLEETNKLELEYEESLKELGVNFYEVDMDAFNKAVEPVYSKFPKWSPGIYDEIMTQLTKIREELK